MRVRLTSGSTILTRGHHRTPPCEWECDVSALPEWDPTHRALREGRAEIVDDAPQHTASTPAPEPAAEKTTETEQAPKPAPKPRARRTRTSNRKSKSTT